jgi:glycosyltransferase involved in cell wall biosynthesis
MRSRPRLCYVVATEMTVAAFLSNHMRKAADGYEVAVAMNSGDPTVFQRMGLAASLLQAPIERRISPWRDLHALWVLYGHFRRQGFDIVHSVTPKAGLLGMLAAWLARVPCRIHTFTGQVWATKSGWRRSLLKTSDCLVGALTTHVLVDSTSQLAFLEAEGVLPRYKGQVIGKGSICGVDGTRFRPNPVARGELRRSLGIPETVPLLLFLGRLNRDKGVLDLAAAFPAVARQFPESHLLLVGPDEEQMLPGIRDLAGSVASRVHHVGYTDQPESYMAAADVFCLPSYREGFGQVLVEAAAAGIPAVASRIYGITDAVVEGATGLLHRPGDVRGIEAALAQLLGDAAKRAAMGAQARRRALEGFSQSESTRGLMDFYGKMRGR